MELISKEVVKRIIDSGRTREQMLEMAESVVAFQRWKSSAESTDSSTDDCISRKEVLNILKREGHKYAYGEWIDAIRDVNILPSVKPKERTGEWQQDMDGTYLCSECGSGFEEQPTCMGNPMFAFCPVCGARMREVAEE